MTPVDRLLAIEEIRNLKAEYFRCVDGQQWEKLVTLFADGAETDMRAAVEPYNPDLLSHDPAAFVKNTAYVFTGVKTAHFGSMPQIRIVSETEATGSWTMEDILWVSEDSPVLPTGRHQGWGHYEDRYRKVDGQWRFAACKLTRIHLEYRK